jgi:hypothetical protein
MHHTTITRIMLGLVAAAVTLTPTIAFGQPFTVSEGYDLFETESGETDLLGIAFEGVPLNLFDFGLSGLKDTGRTDTIVKRIGPANAPAPGPAAPIDIELVALQLKSVDPVDLGAGLDYHFATLDLSTPSLGEMTITFDDADGGLFDSILSVHFDLRIGALDGPIISNDTLDLSTNGVPWSRTRPPNAVPIPGVNDFLNGANTDDDFWPGDSFSLLDPLYPAMHTVAPATPEPATMGLLALGGLAMLKRKK